MLRGRAHPGGLGTHRTRPLWTEAPTAECWASPEEEGGGNPTWLNSGLGAREEQWIPAEQEPSPTQCLKLLPPQPAPLQSLRAG